MGQLQPKVIPVTIGIRELKEVNIYPMAVSQQLKARELIVEAVSRMSSVDEAVDKVKGDTKDGAGVIEQIKLKSIVSPVVLGSIMLDTIESSLSEFLSISTDPDDEVTLESVTNEQAVDIALAIYELNYEGAIKKVQGLVDRVKTAMNLITPVGPKNKSASTK